MRDIKFRGLSEGKWYYGLLTFMFSSYAIVDPKDENTVHLVDEKTVGQYTGLKDKNGVEIYEGDIITILRQDESYIIQGSGWEDVDTVEGFEFTGVVEVMYSALCLKIDRKRGIPIDLDVCELIGNIYENPELLEEITK